MIGRIKTLIEEEEPALYFHQDSRNRYKFDESCLPSGGVYGLRKRRNDDEDRTKRVTASKLTPIKTSSEFERHLRSVSEITYIRGGRRNTTRKIRSFSLELCIVLIKKRVVTPLPTPSITCESSGYTQVTSVTSISATVEEDATATTKKKRKTPPTHFSFPAVTKGRFWGS